MTPDAAVARRIEAPRGADWNDASVETVKIGMELRDEMRPAAGVRRYRLVWDEQSSTSPRVSSRSLPPSSAAHLSEASAGRSIGGNTS